MLITRLVMDSSPTNEEEHVSAEKARQSYIRELRRNVREWTKARDEWIALAGGVQTAQSRECEERVREARAELRRLHA